MKHIFLIFSILIGLTVLSQKTKVDWEDLDLLSDAHIPAEAKVYGYDDVERLRFVKDKVLIYNVWSPFCIECNAHYSELLEIEKKYPEVLLVNFMNPADLEIYSSDRLFQVWQSFEPNRPIVSRLSPALTEAVKGSVEVNSFMLIDRASKTHIDTEKNISILESFLDSHLEVFSETNDLSTEEIHYAPSRVSSVAQLRIPTKIISNEIEKVLYIADTWNNRVVAMSPTGEIYESLGSGVKGYKDGGINSSKFNNPRGIALNVMGDLMYVADTENHAIREVNLGTRQVKTILGNGFEAEYLKDEISGTQDPISYPSDVAFTEGFLFVSLQKSNKIYKMDLSTGVAELIAGDGNAVSKEGKLLEASFNGPSGLIVDGEELLVFESGNGVISKVGKKKVSQGFSNVNEDGKVSIATPKSMLQIGSKTLVLDAKEQSIFSISADGSIKDLTNELIKGQQIEKGYWSDFCHMDGFIFVLDAKNNCVIKIADNFSSLEYLRHQGVSVFNLKKAKEIVKKDVKIDESASSIELMIEICPSCMIEEHSFQIETKNKVSARLESVEDRLVHISFENPENLVSFPLQLEFVEVNKLGLKKKNMCRLILETVEKDGETSFTLNFR